MAISVNTPVSREFHPGQIKRTRWTRQSLATAFLLVFLVYFLLPFFWLIVSATKTNPELFTSFGLWFASDFNLFKNLGDLFTHDGGVFLTWLWNTAYYATCTAVGASLIATIAGYAFAKFQFPGRTLVFAIILGSIMVPSTALAIPTYLLLSKIGLINTPLAVILPFLVSPFGGEMRIFWSVALRILVPGFVTVLLFSFVATWNNYFLPLLVLSDPTYYPLTLGLASWNAQASANGGAQLLFTLVLTGSLISILPLIVAFLFLQRYWQGGLTLGSIRS